VPINANVTNQQITASVGETQIDVSVAGGFGPSGANGAAASVQVGTVTTGAPGSSASVVNAGTSSAAVLNFTIPAGATGAQGQAGATGAQGIQGIQGPAGATGATGPAGSNATATTDASALVSGTLPDARLSSAIARTSDITTAVANVVNAAPAALDTLNELAAALGNDASFSATVTNALAAKAPLASPTFTGTVAGVTKAMVGLGNADNTSDASKPISTATQTALDGKAATSHTHGSISSYGTVIDQISTAIANPVAFGGLAGNIGRGAWGTESGTFCQGNDSRLSNDRTPTAHKASHSTGGSDALTPADIGAAASSHTHTASAITDFASAVAAASPEEVVEYTTAASFPASGNASLLYRASDSARLYAWVGSQYAEVGPTSVGGGATDGNKGDVTVSGSGATWAINAGAVITADLADGAVTDAKISAVAASKLTGTVATARLGTGTADSTTVLRGDGAWAAPADSVLRALFVPPAPTSLTVSPGNAQVTLSWSAPSVIAQAPITDYVVQFSSDSGSAWTTFADATSTATSATVTGLTNGTAYVFRVAAVNAVGTGAYAAASSAATPGAANLTKAASGAFSTASGSGTTTSPLAWSGSVTTASAVTMFTVVTAGTLNLSLTLTGGTGEFGSDLFEVTRNGSVVFTPSLGSNVTRSTTFSVSVGDVIRINVTNESSANLTAFSARI
jgi:hypothetical protein